MEKQENYKGEWRCIGRVGMEIAMEDPKFSWGENNQWVFEIPQDVQKYFKNEFGEDIQIAPLGDAPQSASRGYLGYYASRNGEVVGKIQVAGATEYRSNGYGYPTTISVWQAFKNV